MNSQMKTYIGQGSEGVLSSDVSVESGCTPNQEAFPNLIVPEFLLKFHYKGMTD